MQRAISPAIAPSSALRRQLGAGSVDHGDQRQPELLGQSHRPARLAQRGRAHRVAGRPGGSRSCPTSTHGWPSSRVSATITVSSRSPSSVPRSRRVPVAAVPQQVAYAGPPGVAGPLDRLPRPTSRRPVPSGAPRQGAGGRRVHEDREGAVDQLGQVLGRHDRVDDPLRGEVLGGLHAFGERLAGQSGVHLGAEEPDQRPGLGDGDVAERSPGGVDAAGGRVPQVHEVGQPGGAVVHQRAGDLHHLARTPACPPASGCRRTRSWPAPAGPRQSRGVRRR